MDFESKRLFLICCLYLSVAGSALTYAQGQKEVYVANVDQDGVQRVRILGGDYFFEPNYFVGTPLN